MIYFSIDIETTGIDWDKHTILEFGAILEDTKKQLSFDEIPKFNCLLRHPDYVGTPLALAMHKEIFEELESGISKCDIIPFYDLGIKFYAWLMEQNNKSEEKFLEKSGVNGFPVVITVAGKNFGTFDLRFLENLGGFKKHVWFRKRIIDPAILYYDDAIDTVLPNLEICKERAGIKNTAIAHRTIQDAWDVIEVLRGKLYPKIN